jgi:hypothetical protein
MTKPVSYHIYIFFFSPFFLSFLDLHFSALFFPPFFLIIVDVEFGRLQARDMLQHLWTGPIRMHMPAFHSHSVGDYVLLFSCC